MIPILCRLKTYCLVLCLPVCCFGGVAAGSANRLRVDQSPIVNALNSDAEVLLAVEFSDGLVVLDSMSAYEVEGGVLVPAREFLSGLGVSVDLDVNSGRLSGFVLREENTFVISLSPCRLMTASGELPFDCSAAVLRSDDLFLTLEQLQSLLPATLDLDRYAAKIVVHSQEPFPPQERQRRSREGLSPIETNDPSMGDIHLGERRNFSISGMSYAFSGTGTATSVRTSRELAFHGGLLGLESRFRHSASSDGSFSNQLALSEYGENSVLELVDFVSPAVPMVGSPGVLRGLHYANYSDESALDSLVWEIDGVAPDQWDVELTQNGQLVQRTRASNGRYLFQRVRLQTGVNRFMIILLGPQGQRRTEFRSIDFEPNLSAAQRLRYRLISGVDEQGRKNHIGFGLLKGGKNWGVRFLAGEITLPKGYDSRALAGGGLLWFGNELSSTLQFAAQQEGRWGSEWVVRRPFHSGLLAFTRQDARGFGSFQFRVDQGQTLKTKNSLSGFVQVKLGLNFFNDVELSQTEFHEGGVESELKWRLSTQIAKANLLYELKQIRGSEVATQGQLTAGLPTAWGDTRLVVVQDSFRRALSQIQGQLTFRLGTLSGLQASMIFMPEEKTFDSSLDYRWVAAEHSWSLGTAWRSANNEAVFQASMSSSLDFLRVHDDRLSFTRFDRSDYVTTKVQVQRKEDGSPYEGVEILMNGQRTGQRTNSNGIAILTDLPRRQTSRISVRTDDLDDLYLQSQPSAWRVRGSTGRNCDLVFKLKSVGDVSGSIRSAKPNQPVGGIRLSLIDTDGAEVMRVRTSNDGYFYFGGIEAGKYQVRVAPEDLLGRDLRLVDETIVEVVIDPLVEMSVETSIQVK